MNVEERAAATQVLSAAKSGLIDGLLKAGAHVTADTLSRVGRAFETVMKYCLEEIGTVYGIETFTVSLLPFSGASDAVVSAANTILNYVSEVEVLATSIVQEVMKSFASATGTILEKVAVAFLRALVANFGLVLPANLGA